MVGGEEGMLMGSRTEERDEKAIGSLSGVLDQLMGVKGMMGSQVSVTA